MKQTLKTKLFPLLKKVTIITIIIFITTFIQIYWAMGSLSERNSSGCLNCTFSYDAYLMSLISAILLSIVFLFLSFIKNSYLKVFLQLLFLISIWFFWNYSIFIDRESSWSTFRFKEELFYTLTLSFLPISILSIITVFTLHYILKKYESK